MTCPPYTKPKKKAGDKPKPKSRRRLTGAADENVAKFYEAPAKTTCTKKGGDPATAKANAADSKEKCAKACVDDATCNAF